MFDKDKAEQIADEAKEKMAQRGDQQPNDEGSQSGDLRDRATDMAQDAKDRFQQR